MTELNEFIESGILELYVLGQATTEQTQEVQRMSAIHPDVRTEIEAISNAFETYASSHAVEPHSAFKHLLLATVNYMTRMENGEPPSFPPMLRESSRIEDYDEWLKRDDLKPNPLKDIHVRIIGYSPENMLAIVWLKDGAPAETHTNEHESFLVVEGSCDVYVASEPHSLKAGDVFPIPMDKPHWIAVTSEIPCKVILQRRAA